MACAAASRLCLPLTSAAGRMATSAVPAKMALAAGSVAGLESSARVGGGGGGGGARSVKVVCGQRVRRFTWHGAESFADLQACAQPGSVLVMVSARAPFVRCSPVLTRSAVRRRTGGW